MRIDMVVLDVRDNYRVYREQIKMHVCFLTLKIVIRVEEETTGSHVHV